MLIYAYILGMFLLNQQAYALDTTTCSYVRYEYVEAPCFGGGDFGIVGAVGTWHEIV